MSFHSPGRRSEQIPNEADPNVRSSRGYRRRSMSPNYMSPTVSALGVEFSEDYVIGCCVCGSKAIENSAQTFHDCPPRIRPSNRFTTSEDCTENSNSYSKVTKVVQKPARKSLNEITETKKKIIETNAVPEEWDSDIDRSFKVIQEDPLYEGEIVNEIHYKEVYPPPKIALTSLNYEEAKMVQDSFFHNTSAKEFVKEDERKRVVTRRAEYSNRTKGVCKSMVATVPHPEELKTDTIKDKINKERQRLEEIEEKKNEMITPKKGRSVQSTDKSMEKRRENVGGYIAVRESSNKKQSLRTEKVEKKSATSITPRSELKTPRSQATSNQPAEEVKSESSFTGFQRDGEKTRSIKQNILEQLANRDRGTPSKDLSFSSKKSSQSVQDYQTKTDTTEDMLSSLKKCQSEQVVKNANADSKGEVIVVENTIRIFQGSRENTDRANSDFQGKNKSQFDGGELGRDSSSDVSLEKDESQFNETDSAGNYTSNSVQRKNKSQLAGEELQRDYSSNSSQGKSRSQVKEGDSSSDLAQEKNEYKLRGEDSDSSSDWSPVKEGESIEDSSKGLAGRKNRSQLKSGKLQGDSPSNVSQGNSRLKSKGELNGEFSTDLAQENSSSLTGGINKKDEKPFNEDENGYEVEEEVICETTNAQSLHKPERVKVRGGKDLGLPGRSYEPVLATRGRKTPEGSESSEGVIRVKGSLVGSSKTGDLDTSQSRERNLGEDSTYANTNVNAQSYKMGSELLVDVSPQKQMSLRDEDSIVCEDQIMLTDQSPYRLDSLENRSEFVIGSPIKVPSDNKSPSSHGSSPSAKISPLQQGSPLSASKSPAGSNSSSVKLSPITQSPVPEQSDLIDSQYQDISEGKSNSSSISRGIGETGERFDIPSQGSQSKSNHSSISGGFKGNADKSDTSSQASQNKSNASSMSRGIGGDIDSSDISAQKTQSKGSTSPISQSRSGTSPMSKGNSGSINSSSDASAQKLRGQESAEKSGVSSRSPHIFVQDQEATGTDEEGREFKKLDTGEFPEPEICPFKETLTENYSKETQEMLHFKHQTLDPRQCRQPSFGEAQEDFADSCSMNVERASSPSLSLESGGKKSKFSFKSVHSITEEHIRYENEYESSSDEFSCQGSNDKATQTHGNTQNIKYSETRMYEMFALLCDDKILKGLRMIGGFAQFFEERGHEFLNNPR